MNHKIASFLYSNKDTFKNISTYLYNNPEVSYKERNASKYLSVLLSKFGFNVTDDYMNIANSFRAVKGDGYPRICFLCEYDGIEKLGHITGHNVLSMISVAAATSIGNVLPCNKGSIIVIGCPGEYLGGSKGIMAKQGAFNDIDIVMCAHPNTITCESGTSYAIEPLGVTFSSESKLSFINSNNNPLDAAILLLNTLNAVKTSFPKELEITYVISKGGSTPLLIPNEVEIKFYIRAKNSKSLYYGDALLRKMITSISDLTSIKSEFFLYEQPNKELITNHCLNRLFSHNLKETGIIHIDPPRNSKAGLSIGDVSHIVPTIHPYINICDNPNVKYASIEFAQSTISDFCIEQSLLTAKALAYTALDIINSDVLLNEIKSEFYK